MYWAHRAVVFAIARLSCCIKYESGAFECHALPSLMMWTNVPEKCGFVRSIGAVIATNNLHVSQQHSVNQSVYENICT